MQNNSRQAAAVGKSLQLISPLHRRRKHRHIFIQLELQQAVLGHILRQTISHIAQIQKVAAPRLTTLVTRRQIQFPVNALLAHTSDVAFLFHILRRQQLLQRPVLLQILRIGAQKIPRQQGHFKKGFAFLIAAETGNITVHLDKQAVGTGQLQHPHHGFAPFVGFPTQPVLLRRRLRIQGQKRLAQIAQQELLVQAFAL